MNTFKFDIMLNGRFVCTLRYKYCALFPIDSENLDQIDSSIYITKMCLFVRIGNILFNLIRRKDYVPDNPV